MYGVHSTRYDNDNGTGALREPVARTRDQVEELRRRVQEVEHLRREEQQHCLREVPENADDGERHAAEVAERVAHKGSRWIPGTMYNIQSRSRDPAN